MKKINKNKVLAIAAVLGLGALTIGGGSLAYFTDKTEVADNVFTFGNVDIDLIEYFDPDTAVLLPGVDVNKDVYVENTGESDAYTRVHIAIPASADDGDPSFNASHNFLHFNFTMDSVAAGQWSWIPRYTDGTGYLGNGSGNWNFYTTTINSTEYNVYVVTYRTKLAAGERTATQALDKVYLDRSVVTETVTDETTGKTRTVYKDNKGNTYDGDNLDILVVAEAAQADGFDDAYAALNTAFGVPGTYNPFN